MKQRKRKQVAVMMTTMKDQQIQMKMKMLKKKAKVIARVTAILLMKVTKN